VTPGAIVTHVCICCCGRDIPERCGTLCQSGGFTEQFPQLHAKPQARAPVPLPTWPPESQVTAHPLEVTWPGSLPLSCPAWLLAPHPFLRGQVSDVSVSTSCWLDCVSNAPGMSWPTNSGASHSRVSHPLIQQVLVLCHSAGGTERPAHHGGKRWRWPRVASVLRLKQNWKKWE
jgi:hypothetical protein